MRLDHFVVNVEKTYQRSEEIIKRIREAGMPYEPKWGKGTKGFKVSNLWIGDEYLEMVNILKKDGGGWVSEWTKRYNQGHRGMICLMLDVRDMDSFCKLLGQKNIKVSAPQWLEFKWFFNLFTRRMPWRNCYLPFFETVPFQIGFQEMRDEKAREFMNQYMVPNARQNGIEEINRVIIHGNFSNRDFERVMNVFEARAKKADNSILVELSGKQAIEFRMDMDYYIELFTNIDTGKVTEIENVKIYT